MHHRRFSIALSIFALALTVMFFVPASANAQLPAQAAATPDWAGKLVLGYTQLTSADPASAQEELPGLGHKFELYFAMHDSKDPQNPTNDDISVVTTADYPAGIGVAFRNMPPGIKIAALDHQLGVRYFFFPPRTCAGGSPRIQLAIDRDGDGNFDGNAFGYVGHGAFGTGCLPPGEWDQVDMTDNAPRWDLSQLGGTMTMTWDQAQAFVTAVYPHHQVLSGSLVDDSGGFTPVGEAHYDLLTIENRSLQNDQDTVKNGK